MAITEVRRPYEFLARWNPATGAFSGSHIQFFDAVERDGVQIAGQPSKAYGVGEAGAFPLADIVSTVTADALAQVEAQAAQIAALTADKSAADQARDAALAQVADLQAQLAALQGDVINGVPQRVTMRQARLALHAAGLLAGVDVAIDALPEPQKTAARIEWDYSSAIDRLKPVVVMLGAALGLTPEQIDQLFVTAATL